jgi:hypothetical protein
MFARLVRPALRLLPGAGYLHGRQLLFPRDVEIRFLMRVGGDARVVRQGPRTSRSRTCRARRRQVPLVENWSEMQPPAQRRGVLPVRVLTKICMPSLRRSTR